MRFSGLISASVSCFLPVFGLLYSQDVYSQQLSVAEPLVYDQKEIWFDNIVGPENTGLLNGREYFIAFPGASSHPFFGSREVTNERLVFHSQLYVNVPLLYDIFTDEIILRHRDKRNQFTMIVLDKDRVESFTLYNHHFKRKELKGAVEPHLAKGFFDVLFEGESISLVAKRRKTSYANVGVRDYQEDSRFFLIKGDQWIELGGKKSYYALSPRYKTEIQDFIKRQKIKVGRKNEADLIQVAKHCDLLEGGKSKR
ncbi:MAG TPA: hypothetical protein VG737_07580 [Cyclobacteriaceae bacterium]|nr:hypothetical protein [Cyclobacteriaceae bacterium]